MELWEQYLTQCLDDVDDGVRELGSLEFVEVQLPAGVREELELLFAPRFEQYANTESKWQVIEQAITTSAGFMGFVAAEKAVSANRSEINWQDMRFAVKAAQALCTARLDTLRKKRAGKGNELEEGLTQLVMCNGLNP